MEANRDVRVDLRNKTQSNEVNDIANEVPALEVSWSSTNGHKEASKEREKQVSNSSHGKASRVTFQSEGRTVQEREIHKIKRNVYIVAFS
jgi:hypothetical protein